MKMSMVTWNSNKGILFSLTILWKNLLMIAFYIKDLIANGYQVLNFSFFLSIIICQCYFMQDQKYTTLIRYLNSWAKWVSFVDIIKIVMSLNQNLCLIVHYKTLSVGLLWLEFWNISTNLSKVDSFNSLLSLWYVYSRQFSYS